MCESVRKVCAHGLEVGTGLPVATLLISCTVLEQ